MKYTLMSVLALMASFAMATPQGTPPGLDKGGNSNADAKSTSISGAQPIEV